MTLEFNTMFGQRDVRETPAGTSTSTSSTSILAPVGAIMPWLKSYTNTPQTLPTGWVEADGAVVSDADSVYNGQTLPDLNGGIFLRGYTTSGGTGGAAAMAHTHTGTASGTTGSGSAHKHTIDTGDLFQSNADSGSGGFAFNTGSPDTDTESAHTHSFSDGFTTSAASNTENRPPYYDVVWIMRIK